MLMVKLFLENPVIYSLNMSYKKAFLLILLAILILGAAGYVFQRKTLKTATTPSLFIERKMNMRNITLSSYALSNLHVACSETPNEHKSDEVIIGCTNLYSKAASSTAPGILVGTSRFDLTNPKTPETLARQTLAVLHTGTSTGTMTCTETDFNSSTKNTLCKNNQGIHVLIRTYSTNIQPYPVLWLGLSNASSSEKILEEVANRVFVPLSANENKTSLLDFVVEKAYAGGGGGGGGGDSSSSDPAADPSVSPCGTCVCDGTCPANPWIPPCDCNCNGSCPPPPPPPCTDCSCLGNCPPPPSCTGCDCPGACPPPPSCTTCDCLGTCPVFDYCAAFGWGCPTTPSTPSTPTYPTYNSYESYESYPSYPTYSGQVSTISSFTITPRSLERGGLANISWNIYHPNGTCKIVAEVQKPASCDAACQTARNTASSTLNALLSSGTTNTNDSNGANRSMNTALNQANGTTGEYAKGTKSVTLDYSTTFTVSCGANSTPFKSIIYVTERVEG